MTEDIHHVKVKTGHVHTSEISLYIVRDLFSSVLKNITKIEI